MKSTPGPWIAEEGTTKGSPIEIIVDVSVGGEACHLLVARVYDGSLYENEPQKLANARLIAAAPELVEALEIIKPFLADLVKRPRTSASMQRIGADAEDALEVVRAALAKVRGEGQ